MVREFGMSDRLGPVGFSDESPQYLGGQQMTSRPYAEETQRVIDEEVQRLLQEAEEHATGLLKSHLDQLERVVELLVERETIDGAEVLAAVRATDRAEPVVIVDVTTRPCSSALHCCLQAYGWQEYWRSLRYYWASPRCRP